MLRSLCNAAVDCDYIIHEDLMTYPLSCILVIVYRLKNRVYAGVRWNYCYRASSGTGTVSKNMRHAAIKINRVNIEGKILIAY